jgi:hypothetical protein
MKRSLLVAIAASVLPAAAALVFGPSNVEEVNRLP